MITTVLNFMPKYSLELAILEILKSFKIKIVVLHPTGIYPYIFKFDKLCYLLFVP